MPRNQRKPNPDCDGGNCKPVDRKVVLDYPDFGCFDECKTVKIKGDHIKIKSVHRKVKQDTVKVRPADLNLLIEQPDIKVPKDKFKVHVKRECPKVEQGKVELDVLPAKVHIKEQRVRILVKKGKCHDRCKPEFEVVCDKPECIVIEPEVCVRNCGKSKVTCSPPNICVEYVDCFDKKGKKEKKAFKGKYEADEDEEDAELWEGEEASE